MRIDGFTRGLRLLVLGIAVSLSSGCKDESSPSPSGGGSGSAKTKKMYWVQPLRGHAVHQLTQTAFTAGCEKAGYACEIIGTDAPDQPGTAALAEQVLSRGDAAGMAVWASDPVFYPLINEAGERGIPVVIVHFPTDQSAVPGALALLCGDPSQYARDAAMEIGTRIDGKGTVAITKGSSNSTENLLAQEFTKVLNEKFPGVKVRPPDIEGFDPPQAIRIAANILQSDPNIVAAFTTTGGEPPTWPGAQQETGRQIVNIGVNYTRANLDAVKNGTMRALIAQPLWEESYQAAEVLAAAVEGKRPEQFWIKLPAPLVKKDGLAPYYEIIDKADAARR